jgi:hypothetical protein
MISFGADVAIIMATARQYRRLHLFQYIRGQPKTMEHSTCQSTVGLQGRLSASCQERDIRL